MAAARFTSPLPDPYSAVSLYTDISAAMTQKRREFSQVNAILRNHNILYKSGFPTKLVVKYQNQTTNIFTPKDGIKRMLNWGLISSPQPELLPQRPQSHNQDARHNTSATTRR